MSLVIGGVEYTPPPPPPPFEKEASEDRAVELLSACVERIKAIHTIERRLEKRWAWREKHLHEQDTPLYQERIALIHDDFAAKHGAWRGLVKASAALQRELERWPTKQRDLWCACWGVEYPCEVFAYQIETDLEATPWAGYPPF
jgi:hypothetical protein